MKSARKARVARALILAISKKTNNYNHPYLIQILTTLDYETGNLFHFTGPYQSTPGCPIKLQNDFNPSSGVPFYVPSDAACSKVASYNMPYFLKRPGPKYSSITLSAHEARPGHHTQVGFSLLLIVIRSESRVVIG